MKRIVMMIMVTSICACHREVAPWKESEKEVAVYVRSSQLTATTLPTSCQLFLFDSQNNLTAYTIPSSELQEGNRFQLEIPEGRYTGYCVANSGNPKIWEYTANSTPSKVFLSLQQSGESWQEAEDYLLGKSEFSIENNNSDPVFFDVERKVGCLKVIIENIPDWMSDLNILLSNIPPKMNLLGKYSGENVTVSKAITQPDGNKRSVTHILVFPSAQNCSLTLSYKAGVATETTPAYTIDSIVANHITEVKAIFQVSENTKGINFSTGFSEWNDTVIREEDWYINLPGRPCQGKGNGINLVQNGSFEEGSSDTLPDNWKLDAGGSDKKISRISSPVMDGAKAVRIEGKTYLYQDIKVTAGLCYQLHLFINSPFDKVKWRYWGTWMAGSKQLESDALRSSSYLNKTNGYEDVYAGNIFQAPATATKLRIEIRGYSDRAVTQDGLYIDSVSVEKVE